MAKKNFFANPMNYAILAVIAVALLFINSEFGLVDLQGPTGAVVGVPQAQTATVQVDETPDVSLAAYRDGLNLASREQLAISYVVWQGADDIKGSGTLSATAFTTFTSVLNERYDWAAYDDNGAGNDYYQERGEFVGKSGNTPSHDVWLEVTPATDISVSFVEKDGTSDDGTIAIGSSGAKTVGMDIELNDINKKYNKMFACIDFDTGNFTDVKIIGGGAAPMSTPTRLSSYEDCFSLGKSLPTASDSTAEVKVSYTVSLQAKAGVNPVQNVTVLLGDLTQYIDALSGVPNGLDVAEDKDNSDVGAADKTQSINVQ